VQLPVKVFQVRTWVTANLHSYLTFFEGFRMLNEYLPIAILFILATGLAGLVMINGHAFGPRQLTERKSQPYESGIMAIGQGTQRMPVHFYLVAVLFILFDIEVVLFFPWAVVFRSLGIFGLVEMLILVLILLVGYFYAWEKGALAWEQNKKQLIAVS